MNLVYLILYTFVLALGEAFHQPQALAEQSSLQRKLTNDTQQMNCQDVSLGNRMRGGRGVANVIIDLKSSDA